MIDDTHAVQVTGLTVSYASHPVLWDVDATFPRASLSAICGPNGAGKSTLLLAALGLVPIDAGRVLVLGEPIRTALRRVAYVPQREAVDWDFPITVSEVVEMGRYGRRGWFRRLQRSDRTVVEEALERVGMAPFAHRQIGALSGGQRQRVFVARALAQDAEVLLLDEPLTGIDARTEQTLIELFRELRDAGRTVICVHHDLETIGSDFDWVTLLNVRTIACGPAAKVLTPENLRSAYGGTMKTDSAEPAAPRRATWAG